MREITPVLGGPARPGIPVVIPVVGGAARVRGEVLTAGSSSAVGAFQPVVIPPVGIPP
jgi:hypothetical protein